MVANETIQMKPENKIVSATVVRLQPLHNGHKKFLVEWARKGKIIVMIGSCYENGEERNCIPASEREKMVRAVYKREGIPESQFEIITQEDTETFDEWITNVKEACEQYGVTHFITGNQEDILDVLEQRGEKLDAEMVNPEEDSDFPYHATDIRKLIIDGNYEELEKLIPDEVKPILFKYTFKEIIASSQNRGIHFVKGRQTVDIIFLVRNSLDGKVYVLLGTRSDKKVDFKGYLGLPGDRILKFETPMKAVVRTFKNVTGMDIKVLDNSLEPAIIRLSNVPQSNLEQLHTIGIYSSEDEEFAGTRGGSSQCFGVFVEDDITKYEKSINCEDDGFTDVKFYEVSEVLDERLAYQQTEMLEKAIEMFNAYPVLIKKEQNSTADDNKSSFLKEKITSDENPELCNKVKELIITLAREDLKGKTITILGHDNIDVDAVLSGILMSRVLDFLRIKNRFCILENVKKDDTYDILGEAFAIDMKKYELVNEDEDRILLLLDHYETTHKGKVIACIDHHPTKQMKDYDFIYSRNSCATAYLIYEIMKVIGYPVTPEDAEMIILSMMVDTTAFRSSKTIKEEVIVAKELAEEFELDYIELQRIGLCLTPIDDLSTEQIISNGQKWYNYGGNKVGSSYLQLYGVPEEEVSGWLEKLKEKRYQTNSKMLVFIIFDTEENLTYEYRITEDGIDKFVKLGILSRGKDIMPVIEKMFIPD